MLGDSGPLWTVRFDVRLEHYDVVAPDAETSRSTPSDCAGEGSDKDKIQGCESDTAEGKNKGTERWEGTGYKKATLVAAGRCYGHICEGATHTRAHSCMAWAAGYPRHRYGQRPAWCLERSEGERQQAQWRHSGAGQEAGAYHARWKNRQGDSSSRQLDTTQQDACSLRLQCA